MSAPYNPSIDLDVSHDAGLYLHINDRPVDETYGVMVMAALAQLCEFPAVRVDVRFRCQHRPAPPAMARMIAASSSATRSGTERCALMPAGRVAP
jgi:hypothetical protein